MRLTSKKSPRYKVEESRVRPGTYNVVDTKRVVAVDMGKSFEAAKAIAEDRNKSM